MRACWPPTGARSISDRWTWRHGAGAFVLALLVVLVIALLQRWGVLTGANRAAMQMAGGARGSAFGQVVTMPMAAASLMGDTAGRLVILGLAMLWLIVSQRRRDAAWLAVTVLGGTLLNLALKQVFAAPRPDLLPHLDMVHSYSFPSGHAAGTMILFGALAMVFARSSLWWTAAVLIALIGVSRVWLGVHWPSDVLAGWVEGVGWLLLCRAWRSQPQDAA